MEEIKQIWGLILVAWWIVSLEPLQLVAEHLAEKHALFNGFIYKLISCYWCATLWVVTVGVWTGLSLPNPLLIGLTASFLVKLIVQLYDIYARTKNRN